MTQEITYTYGYFRPAPKIYRVVGISLILHGILLVLLYTGSKRTRTRMSFDSKVLVTRLLRKGELRDPKLLPRIPVSTPAAKKPVEVSKSAVEISEGIKKELKSKSSAARDKQKLASLSERLKRFLDKGKPEPVEGHPDGVENGDVTSPDQVTAGNIYFTKIYRKIRSNYVLPTIIKDREKMYLKAEVVIYIDPSGKIIKIEFEERSDNKHFDSAIELAIQRSSPLPPPPKNLRKLFKKEGILATFRP